jgi:hypothetical protein
MSDALNKVVEVGSFGMIDDVTGVDAAGKAGERAAATQAQARRESLDYLKETEAKPQFYREQSLGQLGGFYGLPQYQDTADRDQYDAYTNEIADLQSQYDVQAGIGGSRSRKNRRGLQRQIDEQSRLQGLMGYDPNAALEGEYIPAGQQQNGQQQFVDSVQQSPFYNSMIQEGEQGAARHASQFGLGRSGNLKEAFVQNSQNVLQGLVQQRLSGLQGMAQLPSNANQIAGGISGIGQTLAQGQMAGPMAQQQMNSALIGGLSSAAGAYAGA